MYFFVYTVVHGQDQTFEGFYNFGFINSIVAEVSLFEHKGMTTEEIGQILGGN